MSTLERNALLREKMLLLSTVEKRAAIMLMRMKELHREGENGGRSTGGRRSGRPRLAVSGKVPGSIPRSSGGHDEESSSNN